MSQSTVVSYPQVIQQLSPENSEKASDSQVSVILSQGLKQQQQHSAGACSSQEALLGLSPSKSPD
jgi:hypothetical protein